MGSDDAVPADPGWRSALPGASRRGGAPVVATARAMFVSFSVAVTLLLVVVWIAVPPGGGSDRLELGWGLAALGVVPLKVSLGVRRRSLPCAGSDELARLYARRFMLRIAFAGVPALLGFVGAFVAAVPWPYAVGFALTAVGFAAAAPTDARLRAIDEDLARDGCPSSLRAGLYAPPGPGGVTS